VSPSGQGPAADRPLTGLSGVLPAAGALECGGQALVAQVQLPGLRRLRRSARSAGCRVLRLPALIGGGPSAGGRTEAAFSGRAVGCVRLPALLAGSVQGVQRGGGYEDVRSVAYGVDLPGGNPSADGLRAFPDSGGGLCHGDTFSGAHADRVLFPTGKARESMTLESRYNHVIRRYR